MLKNRGLQDIAILIYKVENELCPSYIKDIFPNNSINRYSLTNSDFVLPRFHTETYGKNSLRYLDKKVRNSEFLNMFKAKIRKLDVVGMMEDNCKNCTLWSS